MRSELVSSTLLVTSGYLTSCCLLYDLRTDLWHISKVFSSTQLPLTPYFLFLQPLSVNPGDSCDDVKIPVPAVWSTSTCSHRLTALKVSLNFSKSSSRLLRAQNVLRCCHVIGWIAICVNMFMSIAPHEDKIFLLCLQAYRPQGLYVRWLTRAKNNTTAKRQFTNTNTPTSLNKEQTENCGVNKNNRDIKNTFNHQLCCKQKGDTKHNNCKLLFFSICAMIFFLYLV